MHRQQQELEQHETQQLHHGRRKEANGLGWQEHFVDTERASATKNVGSAVSQSLSYITIPNFATVDERCALHESALKVQSHQQSTTATTEEDGKQQEEEEEDGGAVHILGASISNHNCTRYSVEKLLNGQAKAASGALLDRLLSFLEEGKEGKEEEDGNNDDGNNNNNNDDDEMSDLAHQVFGYNSNLRQLRVKWYSEPDDQGRLYPEPKVNLYDEGGYFLKHEDGMHLTLLVVLSDSFEGGGTAFYKEEEDPTHDDNNNQGDDDDDDEEEEENNKPESIAKPPAGTAIIWGATLLHMALPVTKGKRAVYVGSFELLAAGAGEEAKKDYY